MTTRLEESETANALSVYHNTYPRLKNGVYLSRLSPTEEKSIHVATSTHAIEIFHGGARAIIGELNGYKTPQEISEIVSAPVRVIEEVLAQLQDANFIDTVRHKIVLHNRFQSAIASRAAHTEDQTLDAAFSQLQKRLAPELSQITWRAGVKDGGVSMLSGRQNYGVEIFGSSRTAILICSILLSSGVTNTRIALSSTQEHPVIGDSDLGTGAIRIGDIGLNFRGRLEELSREWSLFPISSHYLTSHKSPAQSSAEQNLKIIVGDFDPELQERFMHDGCTHLVVGKIAGGVGICGPLVLPGLTPCLQCLLLASEDRYGKFYPHLAAAEGTSEELPIAIAHQLAAIAAQAVLNFIDTGESPLKGAQIQLNYLDPVIPVINSIPRHPQCPCTWRNSPANCDDHNHVSDSLALYPREQALL